jgi:hypothetical protein
MLRDKPKTLQDLAADFLYMVGYCIAEWASVEDELFDICWRCLGCTKERAAIVYFKTPTIESRRALADELVKSVLPKKVPASGGHDHQGVIDWDKTNKRLGKLLVVRNRIAHHPVAPRQEFFTAGISCAGDALWQSWFELYIGENERTRGRSADIKPLKLEDLQDHVAGVHTIRGDIHFFHQEVLAKHLATSL